MSQLVRSCGLVFAFERLCVIVDRPAAIAAHPSGATTVTFRDGFEFTSRQDVKRP
jgi:hypothetical protein